jgi:methanogenic corrinoid protein MtbC1
MLSTTPAYNLKVVLKETGLAADTLRAWERRYNLPVPQRTAGGHRLYSQRDIETIKWLMKRQEEGLSISRAVDLWNKQLASGADPLADIIQPSHTPASTLPIPYQPETTLAALRDDWIRASMDFNESTAEQILSQAFSMFPVEAVCLEVLQRGLSEIGNRWYSNRASVQQEHFASALAMRRLDTLLSASPSPTRNQTIIVGCPSGEWHAFTPLLLSLFLRRRGLNVIYLGANVPVEQFAKTVQNLRADLVILVAQQLITAVTLQHTSQVLSGKKIPVGFGGRIFNVHPDLHHSIAGHFLGHLLPSAVEQVDLILNNSLKENAPKPISPEYIAAIRAFLSRRELIELTARQMLEPLPITPENIKTAIDFLGDNIHAALQLGDMSYVSAEVDWLMMLFQSYETEPEQLIHFMKTYSVAVNKHVNGQGKPIFRWLANEIEKLQFNN